MSSNTPGNYTGYVHVKTDRDNIVMPVDLAVLEGGLHAIPSSINFGTLTNNDERSVDLWVMNSGSRDTLVTDVLTEDPDQQLLIVLAPPSKRVIQVGFSEIVATLKFTARRPGMLKSKILVFTNNSNPALATLEVCTKLRTTVLNSTLLNSLYCTLLHFTALNSTTRYFNVLHCFVLSCTVLYFVYCRGPVAG